MRTTYLVHNEPLVGGANTFGSENGTGNMPFIRPDRVFATAFGHEYFRPPFALPHDAKFECHRGTVCGPPLEHGTGKWELHLCKELVQMLYLDFS